MFPKLDKDEAQGTGRWPLLQTFAYHWGLEVKFNPNLDDVFGITNDKQGVRPTEDFWRILAAEGISMLAARRENAWQTAKRKELKEQKAREKQEARDPDIASPAEASAQDADVASSDRPDVPDQHKAVGQ